MRLIYLIVLCNLAYCVAAQQLPRCLTEDSMFVIGNYFDRIQVRSAGDVNGDGLDDVIFVSLGSNVDTRLYYGSTSGLDPAADLLEYYNSHTQLHVAGIGDINKDGYDDLGVLTPSKIIVHFGSIDGIDKSPGKIFDLTDPWTYYPDQFEKQFISKGGDINGDGYADFIVGVPREQEVEIYIVQGSSSNIISSPPLLLDMDPWDQVWVSDAGNVNNDRYDDVMIGRSVFLGTERFLNTSNRIDLEQGLAFYDASTVSAAGDVNGDGFDDVLVGYSTSDEEFDFNMAELYYGKPGGIDSRSGFQMRNENNDNIFQFGKYVEELGDINKDGYDDFIVLANKDGRSRIFLGSPVGPVERGNYWVNSTLNMVSGNLDYNGDGYPDMIGLKMGNEEINAVMYEGSITGFKNAFACFAGELPANKFVGELLQPVGDFNKDGYDDVLTSFWDYEPVFPRGRLILYTGAPIDLGTAFSWRLTEYTEAFAEELSGGGDINGDGFTDFIVGAPDAPGAQFFSGRVDIWFGKSTPVSAIADQSLTGEIDELHFGQHIKFVGDIDNDGFDDLTISGKNSYLFFGSAIGINPSRTMRLPGNAIPIGNINADKFDDLAIIKNDSSFIHKGTVGGINLSPSFKYEGTIISGNGDVNADGFADIFIKTGENFTLYFGSNNGLHNSGWSVDGLHMASLGGDFNNDGYGDAIVEKPFSLFGGNYIGTIAIFFGSANGLNAHPGWTAGNLYEPLSVPQFAGDLNKDGYSDIIAYAGNVEFVYFYGAPLLQDQEPPRIECIDTIQFCFDPNGKYSLKLVATDNSGIDSVAYKITGATNRMGTGTDASGTLNIDISNILWEVWDSSGNLSTCRTKLIIGNKWRVSIPDAYVLNSMQSKANTIYTGYSNNTIRLVGFTTSTAAPYRYRWSNGDTTRFIRVRHDIAGSYDYSVMVTDANGCSMSANTTIKVVDTYCPNAWKDMISRYFPWLLSNPFIQEFIRETSEVKLCINQATVCATSSELKTLLETGAALGECDNNNFVKNQSANTSENRNPGAFNISISPNPSKGHFSLSVNGNISDHYLVRIMDYKGSTIYSSGKSMKRTIHIGNELLPGVYFVEVISGKNKIVQRLIKL